MTDADKTNGVIDKVRKLLARADPTRGATEAEAETSMRLALEMLARHNLSMETVAVRETDATKPGVIESDLAGRGDRVKRWAVRTAMAAAKVCYCDHLMRRDWKRTPSGRKHYYGITHWFVGRADNARAARELAAYLLDAVEALARDALRTSNCVGVDRSRFETNFRDGCANRLLSRAIRLREAADAGTLSTTLPALRNLALVTQDENAAYLKAAYGATLKTSRSRPQRYGLGYREGVAAAETIDLRRGQAKLPK